VGEPAVAGGVRIRSARVEDGEAVAALATRLMASEGKPPPSLTPQAFRRDGFGPGARFATLVAEAANGLVGYALYYPAYDSESASHGLLVSDLFVAEEARRNGIGRALMRAVARVARETGGAWLFWLVIEGNREARAFYDRLGAEGMPVRPMQLTGVALDRLIDGEHA